jgi:hypothetical protein
LVNRNKSMDERQTLAVIALMCLSGCADERPAKGNAASYYPEDGGTAHAVGASGSVPGVTAYPPGITLNTPRQAVQPEGLHPFAPDAISPMPTTRVPVTVPSVPQRAADYQPYDPGY